MDTAIDIAFTRADDRGVLLTSRNPWGDCRICGAPATLDSLDQPMHLCNDCRPDDNWYRCSDCGGTYKREGIGCVGHVVTVERGDRVFRCHSCARAKFKSSVLR